MTGQTVLIVNNELITHTTLQSMFEVAGYTVVTSESGQQAVEKTLGILPDIILSDIMMPEMDGLEFCWQLQQNPKTRLIPVMLLTTVNDPASMLKGFQMGAAGYISTPFDHEGVLNRVAYTLRLRQQQDVLNENDNIEETTLLQFLRLCKEDRISGMVRLTKTGAQGIIHLQDGEIIDVQFEDSIDDGALQEILQWKWADGHFAVEEELSEIPSESEQIADMFTTQDKVSKGLTTKEVITMATKAEQLKDVLAEVKSELIEAESITIVGTDGSIFATDMPEADSTRVGAMVAAFIGISNRVCKTLQRGASVDSLVRGEQGYLAFYVAGNKAVLSITTPPDMNMGMLNMVCREAAEKIKAILG